MADVYTEADSIRAYLTGAAAAGTYQGDHNASLGHYRSTVHVQGLTVRRLTPIAGLVLEFVADANGPGLGTLAADSAGTVRWTPPDGTTGASTAIAQGETKVVAGGDPNQYVVVRRNASAPLSGTETVQLMDTYGTVTGGSDFDEAESTTGEEKYRAVMFRNVSGGSVTGLTIWIDPDTVGHTRIAKQAPTSGALTDKRSAGETSQPAGLTWVNPTTEGTGLSIGTLAADEEYGLWIEQSVEASATADARTPTVLHYSFTADGESYEGQLRGLHRVAEAGIAGYCAFVGEYEEPDITGPPTVFSETVPFDVPLAPDAHHYVTVLKRNRYGLMTLMTESQVFRVAEDGSQNPSPPSDPIGISIEPTSGGRVIVRAFYDTAWDDDPADQWLVYPSFSVGDPDPWSDVPDVVAFGSASGPQLLEWTSDAQIDGTPASAIVRVRRSGRKAVLELTRSGTTARAVVMGHGLEDGDEVTIAGADQSAYNGTVEVTVVDAATFTYTVSGGPSTPATGTIEAQLQIQADSENHTVVATHVDWDGPARPAGSLAVGRAYGVQQAPESFGAEVVTVVDGDKGIEWRQGAGYLQLWAGDPQALVFALKLDSSGDASGLYTTYDQDLSAASGVGTGVVEVLSWTGGDKRIGINVHGMRRMVCDITNATIQVTGEDFSTAPEVSRQAGPVHEKFAHTCFQVWDAATQQWTCAASLTNTGVLRVIGGWYQKATEAECL